MASPLSDPPDARRLHFSPEASRPCMAACCSCPRPGTPLPCLVTSPLRLCPPKSWALACPGPQRALLPQQCGFELVLGMVVTPATSKWLWSPLASGWSDRTLAIYNEVMMLDGRCWFGLHKEKVNFKPECCLTVVWSVSGVSESQSSTLKMRWQVGVTHQKLHPPHKGPSGTRALLLI